MLKVDNKMEELFLSDSVPKNLTIDVEGELDTSLIPLVNFYTGDVYGNSECTTNISNLQYNYGTMVGINNNPHSTKLKNYQNNNYYSYAKYACVTFDIYLTDTNPSDCVYPDKLAFAVFYKKKDGYSRGVTLVKDVTTAKSKGTAITVALKIDVNAESGLDYIEGFNITNNDSSSNVTKNIVLHISKIQIRLTDSITEEPSYVKSVSVDSVDIDGYINGDFSITNSNLIQESFSLTESLCSQDNLKFGLCESAHCEFEVVGRGDKFIGKTIRPYINIASEPKQNRIPLGVFKITEVKKNHTHDIIKKSITAYDRMSILDQDVGDWLTKYMVITDTGNKRSSASPSFTKFGVEYVRQMFSTYVSLMIRLGILSQDDFSVKHVYKDENFNDVNAAGRYSFNFFYPCEIASGTLHETVGCTHALGDGWDAGSPSDEYFRVTVTPRDGKSDEELFNQYMGNLDDWPKSYIGFPNSACILAICEFIDGSIEKYLLNSGDIVYIKKGYKNLTFYIGAATGSFDSQSKFEPYNADSYIISHYKIESVYVPEDLKELVNAHLRLMYYNYGTQSLGSFSSSVSGKDVVRSLLEINGCFFHMDRYGKPEIIYASKAGLYPSEKLYPREDLYPRGMNGPLLSMNRYISMECDDYVVQKYGKIQIKTQSQVKSGESICSYEYIGDENAKNTYIIEDNIFYCAEGTVYEYGSQPEVDEMLKNLFLKIANLNYTPHTTKLRGLPFMECGDRVNLITLTGGIESFIFRRTLKGIHALMDTYEASGDEYNEALNTFDYKVYTPT